MSRSKVFSPRLRDVEIAFCWSIDCIVHLFTCEKAFHSTLTILCDYKDFTYILLYNLLETVNK
jgi:hypothetical protein